MFEQIGAIERAVGHVIDDHSELRVGLDERNQVGQARGGHEDGHGDFEFIATTPERRHQRPTNPVACGIGRGTQADAAKSLFGETSELIGRGGVLGIHATDAVKERGITLENAREKAIVPLVVNDLDNDGAGHAVGAH